jgi:hypothetical protein
MGLAGLCAEVAKLRITLPRDAEVIPLRRAVGGGAGNAEGPETGASGPTTAVTTFASESAKTLFSLVKSKPIWWRRRESNPGPEVICRGLYVRSPQTFLEVGSAYGRARFTAINSLFRRYAESRS